MEQAHTLSYLRELVIFLVAAGVVVPLLHRLRISPVLGYLMVGGVIGPFGLGLLAERWPWVAYGVIADPEQVHPLAELGVIFLLFVIGLELSFARLWAMRRLVFGLGTLQVVVSAVLIGVLARVAGNSAAAAAILGACLALSSTAIVMQLLSERGQLGSRLGRTSFAILLMQDLAVVPILFLVGVLGAASNGSIALSLLIALGKALLVMALIYAIGRQLLRPLLRLVARTGSSEMFMAAILLVVIGTAAVTGAAGLSMALGAFLAGLLLAETEYCHKVEVDIEPFKGLLLGLFFMSVGMGIDYRELTINGPAIVGAVLALLLIKTCVTAGLCMLFKLPRAVALEAGLLLGQGGEFAFVVIGLAAGLGVLESEVARFALLVAGLSMLLTPLVSLWGHRVVARIERANHVGLHIVPDELAERLEDHVVIAGFGRVGQALAGILDTEQRSYMAFDLDTDQVAQARQLGKPVYYGDASRLEILHRAHLAHASLLVVTTDNRAAADRIVRTVRAVAPDLPIYARARDRKHAGQLLADGATEVVPEAVEASLQLAARVLVGLGFPPDAALRRIETEREAELGPLRARTPAPG